jgi:phospholipase C
VKTLSRLTVSLIVIGLLAACATPTPAAPVAVPKTQVEKRAPTATATVEKNVPQPTATSAPQPTATSAPAPMPTPASSNPPALVRDKIKHIIIIMQENRSFDTYFGTYPGADGIPMQNGVPTVCANDPQTKQCIKPYHNKDDVNAGGPHGGNPAATDIDGGKMDGFITADRDGTKACKGKSIDTPGCTLGKTPDVMGWHDAREIPNYWAYAQNFVLQDKMFEPNASWSLPAHLFMVSAWSAECSKPGDPASCTNSLDGPKNALAMASPAHSIRVSVHAKDADPVVYSPLTGRAQSDSSPCDAPQWRAAISLAPSGLPNPVQASQPVPAR